MKATVDKAGRVLIPAAIRAKVGLRPGTEVEVIIDDGTIRLLPPVSGPKLVRVGKRLVARPTANAKRLPTIDVASVIEEERHRSAH